MTDVPAGFPRFKQPDALTRLRAGVMRSYTSPRVRRKERDLRRASARVKARAGGRCEAQVTSSVCTRVGVHAHHRILRSQGGPHTDRNLLWVCLACHDWIHAHPGQAHARFLIVAPTTELGEEILAEAAQLRTEGLLT